GPVAVDHFQRAVNPRVAVLHSPRVRNLAETHQTRHEIVQPLHHAFRPADGEYKIVLLFPVPRDESVELGFLAPPEKIIRHVEPRDRKSTRLNSSHQIISY